MMVFYWLLDNSLSLVSSKRTMRPRRTYDTRVLQSSNDSGTGLPGGPRHIGDLLMGEGYNSTKLREKHDQDIDYTLLYFTGYHIHKPVLRSL